MRIKLGIPMTLNEIANAVGGTASFRGNSLIYHITTDSRIASSGDLFIPIKGKRFDGENYVNDVLKKGCYAISSKTQNADIKTESNDKILLDLASYYCKKLPYILYRIAITGSVGKTTTKEFTKALLSEVFITHFCEGNLNNEIGLPLSILSAPENTQILLMEMGMNHAGEISKMSSCLKPNKAIITNIGSAHIGNLGSRENIAKAKLEIADGMDDGKLFIPAEEELLKNAKNSITVSSTDSRSDYYLESIGRKITLYKMGKKYVEADFAFPEDHLKKCLMFACATAADLGISPSAISEGISRISSDNIRQKLIIADGYHFLDDSYNASYESIIASFDYAKNVKNINSKSLLLGDVLELGDYSKSIHYKIGKNIPCDIFKQVFLFGRFADHTAKGAIDNGFNADMIHKNYSLDRPDITAKQIADYCKPGDLILMKASRAVRLERILEYFVKGAEGD